MSSERPLPIVGKVNSQDLTVSWASDPGTADENTDRICVLTMANGQVRLTMQSATLNLKGMRLTKGHICVFAIFEPFDGDVSAADKASETFMNNIMKHDITKKPAKDALRKCLDAVDKALRKSGGGTMYRASISAFAAKDLTACCVNGGRMFILQNDGNIIRFTSDETGTLSVGTAWKNMMMVSSGYPIADGELKNDMTSPIGDVAAKREMGSLPSSSSIIRAQRV